MGDAELDGVGLAEVGVAAPASPRRGFKVLGVGVSKGLGEAPARRRGEFPGSRARAHGVLGTAKSRARMRRGSTSCSARL